MNADSSEEKRINCEGGFGIMPHRLRKAENININAKFLFLALIELQHEKGYCYASNKYLASQELNGSHPNSVPRWLSELEQNGWIKVEIIRGEKNEVIERRIYTNLNPQIQNVNTPPESTFMTPINTIDVNTPINPTVNTPINPTVKYKKNNIEKEEKENIKRKDTPVNGSPSSPDGDEFKEQVDPFDSFWSKVQYKSQKVTARNEWNKITNNGKNQQKIKEVGEGYERYVSFLAKERARGFDRPHMDMSTFLNPTKMRWADEWKTEREQRQEQPAQTDNQKYWEDHENTQVIASKKVEQPKNLQLNISIARKLGLLDKFLPDEYSNEWKFLPKEIKEVLTSEVVEKAVKQIKDKEETLINQIACVTMLGREGYCNWHDKCEEETGERPLEDVEWYIPFGKKLPSGFWTWLVKYSHNFGLPSNAQVERVRKWFYTTPRSPFHFLFEHR